MSSPPPQRFEKPIPLSPAPMHSPGLLVTELALRPLLDVSKKATAPPGVTIPDFPPQVQHDYERTFVKIINCDHNFCPELPHLYLDVIHLGAQLFYPEEFKKFEQCRLDLPDLSEAASTTHCLPGFEPVIEKIHPIVFRHLQFRRERYSNDPLQSTYDQFHFGDPMYFIGALNVWRRQTGGSKLVSLRDCEPFVEEFESCMKSNGNNYDRCFFEHFNSSICEPGFNCPSLQGSIMQCAQDEAGGGQIELENCFQRIDKFLPCALGEVKESAPEREQIQGAAI